MLGKVRIASGKDSGSTALSNAFIDVFMTDANDAQIKTYLYLLRVMQAGLSTTVQEIADHFNHTERDVKRALQYWEKKGLVRLEYDAAKQLSQICLEDIRDDFVTASKENAEQNDISDEALSADQNTTPRKRSYTPIEMRRFAADEQLSMVIFAAEKYFNHALSASEMQTILYIYEDLAFPHDLLDYLLQYTVENTKGHHYASYMEKTAIAWHESGVRSLEDVRSRPARYDKRVYEVMRALGQQTAATDFEAECVTRWLQEYHFSMELILIACRRTVAHTQTNRFEYTEGILRSWHEKKVSSPEDVAEDDRAHENKRRLKRVSKADETPSGAQMDTRNRFNRFQAQEYDFEAIKSKLVSNR